MKNYILDSSVILRYILTEDITLKKKIAQFLKLNRNNLYSANFMKLEVSNVLAYEIGNIEEVEITYKKFLNLNILELNLDEKILSYARKIALTAKDTVYDASYHTLAIVNNMTFLTFDEKYYKKAKSFGSIELFK